MVLFIDAEFVYLYIASFYFLAVGSVCIATWIQEWMAERKKRKAKKDAHKLAQIMELNKHPQYVRYFRKGMLHLEKTIPEEDQAEIDERPSSTMPMTLLYSSGWLTPTEDEFEGVAASAITHIEIEWASRDDDDDDQVAAW